MSASPLIVTLTLDAHAQDWFDALRSRYFPPERLLVGAHLTMFHALPGEMEAAIAARMLNLATATHAFPVCVTGVRNLGKGAGFSLSAAQAAPLRADLAALCAPALTAQDRQGWRPHITIQNKVVPTEARRTCDALAMLNPRPALATGWALWRYGGGPWEPVGEWAFAS